jgi:hypothetical protein
MGYELNRFVRQINDRVEREIFTCTTASHDPPKSFDEEALEKAVSLLRDRLQSDKEATVLWLAACGFTVMLSPYIKAPLILLPKEFEDAIKAVHERQKEATNDQ